MKRVLPVVIVVLLMVKLEAQITTPTIKANFGVDGDLRANFFNGAVLSNNDDWFNLAGSNGIGIIDTAGAAYILNLYNTSPGTRQAPFIKGMRYAQFQVVNNVMLIDALFFRDHHGDDSTVFASGGNKNGMSPGIWNSPVSQSVPDKNDILDMMIHVRRAGPNIHDSLWMFGGVSTENTTGNRYFDFEMYQTDIYFDRPTHKFYNYGPDAGHTSWVFDGAGNVITPGDIIFTAEYGTSGISLLEARIWINKNTLSITPAAFNWGGKFDGDGNGAQFGYASILPKTAGDFYTGLECANNDWAGAFQLVRTNNALVTNYASRQFMEFSVNLTKLGLDPMVNMSSPCSMPFRRVLAKTRASASFDSELKDFVGPLDFFRAPRAKAAADVPVFCGASGISNLTVTNPVITSIYKWSTPNGHIISDSVGPNITVNKPGMYIVTQRLMDSCGFIYATDTVNVYLDSFCIILKSRFKDFKGSYNTGRVNLNWEVANNQTARYFELERSYDLRQFVSVGKISAIPNQSDAAYSQIDDIVGINSRNVHYRIAMIDANGNVEYSKILSFIINEPLPPQLNISPNPANSATKLIVEGRANTSTTITIYSITGKPMRTISAKMHDGVNVFTIGGLNQIPKGMYFIEVTMPGLTLSKKLLIQ